VAAGGTEGEEGEGEGDARAHGMLFDGAGVGVIHPSLAQR
jgi:hypothetical protein